VVTLRTNSDGSFAYVFEKELENGEHEVYVALTDNTGDIVVQSNPFSFVKTAQAFTYEDDSVSIIQSTETSAVTPETSKTFMITIIMSIIALGIVLILLGQVLRQRSGGGINI
jgi:nitrogen fixation protein